jgi:2,4-didehydro-3-deoxy-L-rhamnonate hydrolase
MKLANVDGRATIVTSAGGIDVAEASAGRLGPSLSSVYDAWTEFVEMVPTLSASPATPFDDAELGAPSPEPRQVFGIGLNYRSHAAESGATVPEIPATFTKFPACITGPFAQVELPSGAVDWEVELVVIMGQRADRVAAADAWAHVAGLTIGQDLSERTVQFAAGAQFSLGKSYRGFAPMGPWLVTPDELDDPDDLALGCRIGDETMQDARTGDLVFSVSRLIEELSAVVPLLPGDVIFTGTPDGVGFTRTPARFLADGDVLESWIDGIGTMTQRFVRPA